MSVAKTRLRRGFPAYGRENPMRKGAVGTLLCAFLLVGASAGSASAQTLFESGIRGKQVANQAIADLGPDAAIEWKVASGEVRIESDGTLIAEVSGLLVTFGAGAGTVGPVTEVFARLVCQKTGVGDVNVPTSTVFVDTANVPLSAAGDAEIAEVISLPSVCVAPIVLISIGRVTFIPIAIKGPWIAASGF